MPQLKTTDEEETATLVKAVVRKILFGLTAAALLVVFFGSWVTIPQGQVGVVFDKARGGVLPQVLDEGWHFKMPIVQWVQTYPVSLRTYSSIGAGEGNSPDDAGMVTLPTVEGQHVDQQISIVYNVDPSKASFVFDKFQGADIDTIEQSFIRRTVQSVATNISGDYSLMDIVGQKKQELQTKIADALKEQLTPWGFNLDRVNLGYAKLPDSIETALQSKMQAQQQAEQAKYQLQQAQVDAQAKVATAEGEAKAFELTRQQLSPEIIQLKALEVQGKAVDKWNGQLPQFTMGNGGATPLIDVSSLVKKAQ